MSQKKIERSLYYYDLELYRRDEQNNKDVPVSNFDMVIKEIFEYLKNEYNKGNEEDIKVKLDNGDQLFIIVDNIKEEYTEYRMVLVRVDALPYVEKDGVLESLDKYIGEDQNIAEITHCVLFYKQKVVGVEFNFAGAKASAIGKYIEKINDDIAVVTCDPKLNKDALKKIYCNRGFSLFDFGVRTDSKVFREILSGKSIFSTIFRASTNADTVEIVIKKRMKKDDKQGFDAPLSIEEMQRIVTENRDDIQRLTISQGAITTDSVNLLSDKLVNKVSFATIRGRMIDGQSVYLEIRRFFHHTVIDYC